MNSFDNNVKTRLSFEDMTISSHVLFALVNNIITVADTSVGHDVLGSLLAFLGLLALLTLESSTRVLHLMEAVFIDLSGKEFHAKTKGDCKSRRNVTF